MAKKFLVSIDLAKNELLNGRIQNLASAPSSPLAGQIYYDTAMAKFGVYNGTTWDYMGTSVATGDVSSNTSSSIDGEVALFSGTGGKTIKRATGTGLAKLTSGVLSTATAGTDYEVPLTFSTGLTRSTNTVTVNTTQNIAKLSNLNTNGLVKTSGSDGTLSVATSGTDYAPATSGTAILKGNGSGGFSSAVSGTDYAPATSGTSILKGNGSGGFTAATAGTDYLTASSSNVLTNKTFDANGTGNSISNIEVADFATNVVDTDGTLASNSDVRIASQKAVKTYVDGAVTGLSWKQSVRVATTANGTLSTAFANGQTIDGVTLVTGDRILIKDQTDGTANGIYVVNASGAPTRSSDADTGAELKQATVVVEEGTANADSTWTLTNNGTITIGTTSLVWALQGTGAVPDATTTVKGKVELATQAEAQAKSSTTVALTPASVADFVRKYTGTIGDGSSTSIAVTHGLGSQYVTAQAYDASTNAQIECDIILTSGTQTTFEFGSAPASNAIRVVIVG